jgi:hypothetical protein
VLEEGNDHPECASMTPPPKDELQQLAQKLSWLGVGFSLGSVVTILPFGNSFDQFDIEWNFLVSMQDWGVERGSDGVGSKDCQ